MTLQPEDLDDLQQAVRLLEHPGFAARLADTVGMPLERLISKLPREANQMVEELTRKAIRRALDAALSTLGERELRPSSDRAHRAMAGVSGAVGGAFGAPGLAVELPITTVVILRSIADIARSQGEDLTALPGQLACLEVFALGGRSHRDDGTETGYYAVRAALATTIADAARTFARAGVLERGGPILARLVSKLSSRFGLVAGEKLAAQAVPALGAVGGAGINLLFINHFQAMARGHFIVRRLERRYGQEVVRAEYVRLRELTPEPGQL